MERIRELWRSALEDYRTHRERLLQRHAERLREFATIEDTESASGASLLDGAEEVSDPSKKGEKPRIRIQLKGRTKIMILFFIFIYAVIIYAVVFYALSFLGDQAIILNEKITSTIAKTYTTVVETYDELKNPGSVEEIGQLMTDFYELLADMAYYEPEKIDRPPHTNPSINRTYAAELGFSAKAVQMLEALPYLNNGDGNDFAWEGGAGDAEFLLYGTFIDFRVDENLPANEDPLYALGGDGVKAFDEDGGRYMKPDYVCLSMLGNHGTTMILNVKNFKLWTINQETGNADPALADVQAKGDDSNYNSLDNYPSRAANLALKDYQQKFRDLEWMPGGHYNGSWDGDNYARLYRENGWPSMFNRTAFKIAREQWEEEESLRWDAEQPFYEVAKYEGWLKTSLQRIESKQNAISDVDAGKELPNDQLDRAKYRQELLDEVNETTANLPKMHEELEAARERLKAVDSTVRKAREERIAKYGF